MSAGDCEREIRELHAFFQGWYNGEIADTDEAFSRFDEVMADDFEIISPGGEQMNRSTVSRRLRQAHGYAAATPMRIWIEAVSSRRVGEAHWLSTYQEWQQEDSSPEGRLSTALFELRPKAPTA